MVLCEIASSSANVQDVCIIPLRPRKVKPLIGPHAIRVEHLAAIHHPLGIEPPPDGAHLRQSNGIEGAGQERPLQQQWMP